MGRCQYNQFMIIGNSWGAFLRCITPDRKRAKDIMHSAERFLSFLGFLSSSSFLGMK
jgi:hypothetical protein